MKDSPWEERAACAPDNLKTPGIDWFSSDPKIKYKAREICQSECPVRQECIQFALDNKMLHGVWGGVDDYEIRRAMSVDAYGDPVERSRPPRCPHCMSKKLTIATSKTRRGYATKCNNCSLSWNIAMIPASRKTR